MRGNYEISLSNGGMSAKADLQSLTTIQAETGCDEVNNEPPSQNSQEASTRSPSRSRSSVPNPFDSQSSLENENGSHSMYRNTLETNVKELTRWVARRKSLIRRIIDKLHLSKSYLPGHVKGEIDQIIHSRESSFLLILRRAYAFIAVNEYCSGYGKVAAIEDLDSDFLMYVSSESILSRLERPLSLEKCLGSFIFSKRILRFDTPPQIANTDSETLIQI